MSNSKSIVFLDLNSGLWPHSLLALKAVLQLDPEDFNIHHVACDEAIPGICPVKESRKRSIDSKAIAKKLDCMDCKFSARTIDMKLKNATLGSTGGQSTLFLGDLSNEDKQIEENEVTEIMRGELDLDREFLGAKIVRIAMYEWILKFKKRDLKIANQEEDVHLRSLVQAAVRFSIHGHSYFQSHPTSHAVLCHSPQYVANNAFLQQALIRGIPVYSLNGSDNLAEMESSAMIWEFGKHGLTRPDLSNWPGASNIRISEQERDRAINHIAQLNDGRSPFVYSSPVDADKQLPIKYSRVLNLDSCILMTLSSLDEVLAEHTLGQISQLRHPGIVFGGQQEWVEETVEWFRHRPEFGLIIRIHPRELPNRRDPVKSEQSRVWESFESRLPGNVVINHPDEKIPVTSLFDRVEGVVTGWSTTALQAILCGVPVVTYDQTVLGFPSDIHFSGSSKSEYFSNLKKLTSKKLDGNIGAVYSWLVHSMIRGSVQLTGRLLHNSRINGPKWAPRLLNGIDRYFYWIWRPIEAWLSVKKTIEGKRIRQLIINGGSDLYENADSVK
jgi:hypothetical protein